MTPSLLLLSFLLTVVSAFTYTGSNQPIKATSKEGNMSALSSRSIARVVPATATAKITRLVGTVDVDGSGTEHALADVDPFILLDFGKMVKNNMPLFGAHPHRGHSVVTVLTKGKISSWDSYRPKSDARHVITAPASYWVDAGTGLFHDETSVIENEDDPSQHMHLFQLWVGVKEEDRKKAPKVQYQDKLPLFDCLDPTGKIVGKGVYHVGQPHTQIITPHPIAVVHIKHQDPNTTHRVPVDSTHGGFVVHCKGNACSYGGTVPQNVHDVLVLAPASFTSEQQQQEQQYLEVQTNDEAAEYLVCTGEPHGEPWVKKLVANGAIIAATAQEAQALVPQVGAMSKAGKAEGGSFAPFGMK